MTLIISNNDIEVFKNEETKKYVYPLGNVIGVRASTDGVLVVGYEEENIKYIGGLQIGDNIVEVNDKKISSSIDITNIINESDEDEIKVTFERDGVYKSENIKLKYKNGKYILGIWVRDKVSGVGTATFYDPSLEKFRAIGHAITDVDTNELLKIKEGEVYNPINLEIIKPTDKNFGKINAEFDTENPIGNFDDNSKVGISGKLTSQKYSEIQLIEVANSNEVNLGQAIILFEDTNRNIKSYEIMIKNILMDEENGKNLEIEVIDENLLAYTGGIIQGMSGAPIIQNNKIIGAITHVFRENPKKGYGIFINEMLK
jgi:stage IV sporulation protein B